MKMINKNLEPVLKSAIVESLKSYELNNEGDFLDDLYLYYDSENYTLALFDDAEKELFSIPLEEVSISSESDILQEIIDTAKYVLNGLRVERAFDKEFICKPFTVSLVNSDFSIEEELIFLDDHTMKPENDLWFGIEKELDEFLENLMQ